MDTLLFQILAGSSAAAAVWGVAQILLSLLKGDKRRLNRRLTRESPMAGFSDLPSSLSMKVHGGGATGFLIRSAFGRRIYTQLHAVYPHATLGQFAAISLSIGAVLGSVLLFAADSFALAFLAMPVGAGLPLWWISTKRKRTQRKITQQLPEALDFLSRVLRSGHSLSMGLKMMSDELPQPLGGEFRKCYDQHTLGSPMEECLKDMTSRIESTDFAFFVTAVLIQRQTGGDLSEVLNNIGGMIRQRVRLQQQVVAKTAEGRFTGYILVAFPGIMFCLAYAFNPQYAGVLLHTPVGRQLLGVAIALVIIGLFAIKKITTIKV